VGKNEKSPNTHGAYRDFQNRRNGELLGKLGKFLVKFVNTACRIHEFHFAGEEGVAVGRDFHFHERVLFAVCPSRGFFRVGAGLAQKLVVGRDVTEHDRAVIGWMNIFFHVAILLKICCKPMFSKFEPQK
jgi:hypothetical protein